MMQKRLQNIFKILPNLIYFIGFFNKVTASWQVALCTWQPYFAHLVFLLPYKNECEKYC